MEFEFQLFEHFYCVTLCFLFIVWKEWSNVQFEYVYLYMLALSFLSNCIVSTFVTMHGSVIVNFMHKIDVELNLLIAESKVFAIFDPIAFLFCFTDL